MSKIITIKKRYKDDWIVPEEERASSLFAPLAADQDTNIFLNDDGTLGFAFECMPLSGMENKTMERLVSMLNSNMPHNTLMQFFLLKSPDIKEGLGNLVGRRMHQTNEIMISSIRQRADFLEEHTRKPITARTVDGAYYDLGYIVDHKLIISVKVPIGDAVPTEKEFGVVKDLKAQVKASLGTIKLFPTEIDGRAYLRLLSTIFHWSPQAAWREGLVDVEEDLPLCDQILEYDTAIEVSDDALKIGDKYVGVMSMKRPPPYAHFGEAMTYIGDLRGGTAKVTDHYAVVVNISFPNPERLKGKMERKRVMTVNQALGPMRKLVPVLGDKLDSLEALSESMKEGNKPIRMSYGLIVFADSEEKLEGDIASLRSLWSEKNFVIMQDKFFQLTLFLNNLPLCSDASENFINFSKRYKTMTTEQVAPMLPIFSEWKGTGSFDIALMGRNGQLMSLSLWDTSDNMNALIAATSGAGKSFLTNEIIMSYLSLGARVWVIDIGRSYKKLCDTLKGDFIEFSDDKNISLNPFSLVENYDEDEDELIELVGTMISNEVPLTPKQKSELRRLMRNVWDKKKNAMSVDDIFYELNKSPDPDVKDMAIQLRPFTSDGSYGRYFKGQNNMTMREDFTVLELDDLQSRAHLRQLVLLQLIFQIQKTVFLGDRKRKNIVVIDEAWQLLAEGNIATFIEHAYRKFRKYNGSIIVCTQAISDLYTNKSGRAIADNSSFMFLLGQKPEAIDQVKESKQLSMPEVGYDVLKTVHTAKGAYSEIFIKRGENFGVGRLVVGEFHKLLYSTDPADIRAINELVEQHGISIPEAINRLIEMRKERRA
ncbi:type IV secretion system protein TraC [Candidatus Parcubacteria bacterium]|nr:MAG: type IV secretion system protein TraC [Candidatus Parcubacteria bacterium]